MIWKRLKSRLSSSSVSRIAITCLAIPVLYWICLGFFRSLASAIRSRDPYDESVPTQWLIFFDSWLLVDVAFLVFVLTVLAVVFSLYLEPGPKKGMRLGRFFLLFMLWGPVVIDLCHDASDSVWLASFWGARQLYWFYDWSVEGGAFLGLVSTLTMTPILFIIHRLSLGSWPQFSLRDLIVATLMINIFVLMAGRYIPILLFRHPLTIEFGAPYWIY